MQLSSPAWKAGEPIPKKYTCDGEDRSPPLRILGAPAGTAAFALVVTDPDAPSGTFVHWTLYDLPGRALGLPEGLPRAPTLPDGSQQGKTSWGRVGYGGPCPPGGRHRYFFRLHALKAPLRAGPGLTAEALEKALSSLTLEVAELMGTYSRP